jgi:hypothetical protein
LAGGEDLPGAGRFDLVLWIAERADGQREVWETLCDNAPDAASHAEILDHLAAMFGSLATDGS